MFGLLSLKNSLMKMKIIKKVNIIFLMMKLSTKNLIIYTIKISLLPKIQNKKLEKLDNESVYIPKFNEAEYLLTYNYNVQQLKLFAKTYKLKVTGNKPQLVSRIFSYLYLSN